MPSRKEQAMSYFKQEAENAFKKSDMRLYGAMIAEYHNWRVGTRR
jgi:hypothetical protein